MASTVTYQRPDGASVNGYRALVPDLYRGMSTNETARGPGRIAFTPYDAAWAQAAWDRTLRFFGRHLG